MPRLSPFARSLLAGALICLGFFAVFHLHRGAVQRRDRLPPEQDLHYLPEPSAMRVMSLGHNELFADLVWIRQIIYFGDEFTRRGDFRFVDRYLRTAIALDPSFRRLYAWAGISYAASGVEVTNAMVRQSNEFLELGLKRFPNDWELNFMLGVNYIHELKTTDERQKQAWKLKGAEHIRRAALAGGGPAWLPVLVATILTKGGETEAAIRHLEEILLTTDDEAVRTHVTNKLKQLRLAALPEMERHREEFARRWHAQLRYAPADLYVLLGEPPAEVRTRDLAIPEVMRVWGDALDER
jgi:tetratricopeptide (TPR) repeat protein